MTDVKIAARVGLFVVIGLVLAAGLLWSFSRGLTFFEPTYDLHLKAASVSGLKGHSSVLMAGVPIGRVVNADIGPDGRGVIIHVKIRSRYRIHADARFVIEQLGFLGDEYVGVYPQANAAPLLVPGAEVVCEQPMQLQALAQSASRFLSRAEETLATLNHSIERIDRGVLNATTLGDVSNTVSNLRLLSDQGNRLLTRVDTLVSRESTPVSLTISNLSRFSADMEQMAGSLRATVSTNQANLTAILDNLESSTRVLDELTGDLHAGRGVAGSLLRDTNLQVNVTQLVDNLTLLSSNLNRYGLLYKPKRSKRRPDSRKDEIYTGRSPFR